MWGRRGRVTRLKQFGTRGVNNRKRRFWVVSCRKKSSLRRSRGEGDRRRRRWWRGGDLASSPLRQRFTLPPPHGFATGRISGRNWPKVAFPNAATAKFNPAPRTAPYRRASDSGRRQTAARW